MDGTFNVGIFSFTTKSFNIATINIEATKILISYDEIVSSDFSFPSRRAGMRQNEAFF